MVETHAEQIDRLADWIIANVEGEPSRLEGAVDTAIRLLERTRWIAVTPETMPKPNQPVLAFYLNSMGKGRRVRAQWAPRRSLEMDHCTDDFEADYDDDTDTAWCPEGWYETNEHEDTHWWIDAPVLFWMPLPSPPVLP